MRYITTLIFVALVASATSVAADTISCASDDHTRNYCRIDTSGGVQLVHQKSHAGCYKNDTWGYDRRGIWVANGCRAVFRTGDPGSERVHSIHYNHNSNSSVNWNNERDRDRWNDEHSKEHMSKGKKIGAALTAAVAIGAIAAAADHDRDKDNHDYRDRRVYKCESKNYKHSYCSVPGYFRRAEIKRQLSRSPCRYNRSWGYDRRGIWVEDGCSAEFYVH